MIHRNRLSKRFRGGFGMVESVLSVVLVSGVVVVALNTAGATFANRRMGVDRMRAQLLASELMSEILAQHYEDPGATVAFGLESGESSTNRADFDDVDDYRGLNDSSPRSKTGIALTGFTNWSRKVTVVRVDPNNPQNIALSESGMKRITVTVQYGGRSVATLTALRSGAIPAGGRSNLLSETVDYVKGTISFTGVILD